MKYDDIINTKWPKKDGRDRMPLNQRAKIFLPFAALTGYEQALDETLQAAVREMTEMKKEEDFDVYCNNLTNIDIM